MKKRLLCGKFRFRILILALIFTTSHLPVEAKGRDELVPTITCPGTQTLALGAACTALLPNYTSLATASNLSVVTQSPLPGTIVSGTGAITITLTGTALDLSTASCSFTVNKVDNIAPAITCQGTVNANTSSSLCSASITIVNPLISDNCGVNKMTWAMNGATTASSPSTGTNYVGTYTFNTGTTTIVYTLTDNSGNTATCTTTVNVTDTVVPTITCPGNSTGNVSAGCSASIVTTNPTISDNCAVSKLTWTLTGATTASSSATGINYVGTRTFNVGVTTVAYSAYDAAGNVSSCSFTVTLNDIQVPGIQSLSSINANTSSESCTATVSTVNPTFSDNCSVVKLTWAMTGATTATSPSTGINYIGSYSFNLGVTTVTNTVTDAAGNTANNSYTVTVTDNVAPLITCPSDITSATFLNACAIIVVTTGPMFSDNCSISKLTWTITGATNMSSPATGINYVGIQIFDVGTSIITYTVTDGSSNSVSCSYNVYIYESAAPTITCQGNVSANVAAASCATSITLTNPTINDNCAVTKLTWATTGATVSTSPATGINYIGTKTFNSGITTVTYTVYDASGNSANCSHTVTINDNLTPTITCPSNVNTSVTAGSCTKSISTTNPTVSDNCSVSKLTWAMSGATLASSPATGLNYVGTQTFNMGTTTVNYTATDAAGNNASCSYTISVSDNILPTVGCPSLISQTTVAGACTKSIAVTDPTYSDNCTVSKLTWTMSGATVAASAVTGINVVGSASFNAGITSISYVVTDGSGNIANCSFNVVLQENVAPSISCINVNDVTNAGSCDKMLSIVNPTISDNCSVSKLTWTMTGVTVASSPSSGINYVGSHLFNKGVTTILYSVYDPSGNMTQCTSTITITDTTGPSLTCPGNQSLELDGEGEALLPDYRSLAGMSDACSTVGECTLVQSPIQGTIVSGVGSQTITLTATDASGNQSTCTFDVDKSGELNPYTIVQLQSGGGNFDEATGSFSIPVMITNPSAVHATHVQVVLVSGNASMINGYTTQVVTFPAGSSSVEELTITTTNDNICGDPNSFTFELQNITGGYNAEIGGLDSFQAIIIDDDGIDVELLNEDFEDGDMSGWIEPHSADWSIVPVFPLSGAFSIMNNSTVDKDWLYHDLDEQPLSGMTTMWTFNLGHLGIAIDPTDTTMVYLAAEKQEEWAEGTLPTGYALSIYAAEEINQYHTSLVRVENGVAINEVISSDYTFAVSTNFTGFRVTRNDNAGWSLEIDESGNFEDLLPAGMGVDNVLNTLGVFGIYNLPTDGSGEFWSLDDVRISQRGCSDTWYSQATGNTSGIIWAKTPVGVPQAVVASRHDSFVIQSSHTVSVSSDWLCNDLTIQNAAVLNAGSFATTLFGDLAASGLYNAADGSLTFKGSDDQFVTGSSLLSFNDCVVDNDNHEVHLNPVTETSLKGVFSIKEGILNTHDNLKLISNSVATASIGRITDDGQLAGKITLQRYIPALANYPYGSWVALGCPLHGETIAGWNDDIITTGFAGSDYPPPYAFNNIQWYDESDEGSVDIGYQSVTSLNDQVDSGHGYFIYLESPEQALDVTGTINQHSFNEALSYTETGNAGDGWNLLVNQYPSEVDFVKMVENGHGVASYYMFDSESNNFKVFNGMARIGTARRQVTSSQAYFVKAAGPGSYLRYDENFKTDNDTHFERELAEDTYATFRMTSHNFSSDECVLYFSDLASAAYEWQYDSEKMESVSDEATSCSLVSSDNQHLSIDGRDINETDFSIPMYVKMPVAGDYTFEVAGSINLDGSCVYVEDMITGNTMRIEEGQSWSIHCSEAYAGERFLIHGTRVLDAGITHVSCNGQENGAIEVISNLSSGPVQLFTQQGFEVGVSVDSMSFVHLPAGDYLMVTADSIGMCPSVQLPLVVNEPQPAAVEIASSSVDHCNNSFDGEIHFEVINTPMPITYSFAKSDGTIMNTGNSETPVVVMENLPAETYTLSILGNCPSQSVHVDLTDDHTVTAEILADGDMVNIDSHEEVALQIETMNATSFQWSIDGDITSDESLFTHEFELAGNYNVGLLAFNEFCSVEDSVMIAVSPSSSINEEKGQGDLHLISTHGWLFLSMDAHTASTKEIEIYGLNGALVWNGKMLADGNTGVETLSWAKGIYVVTIKTEGMVVATTKFVK